MKRHNFKNLKIWQESMKLVSETYELTRKFPDFEKFGLVSQMNRCSVSIPSNIAEGTSTGTDKHFKRYLGISLGSAFEWETQLIVAFNQSYIKKEKYSELENMIQQIQRMITGMQSRF